MKLIKQTHEILPTKGMLKDIEAAARTCYKSEDKITEDNTSAISLVKNLVSRKHYAMLEFGENIIFEVYPEFLNSLWVFGSCPFFKGINVTRSNSRTLISMNPRTALELLGYVSEYKSLIKDYYDIKVLCGSLVHALPDILREDFSELDYIHCANPISQDSLISKIERLIHFTYTVKFITNRGVSHELVRHRHASFAQESTRYVDYSGDIDYIEPVWYDDIEYGHGIFNYDLHLSEEHYKELRILGWTKQQAREVLPNAMKTEIIVKASIQEWNHILELRCAKDAHPQMRDLMIPLKDKIK